MAIVSDVVNQALKKAGIVGDGQAIEAGVLSDGIADLTDMLAQWNIKRWLVWGLLEFQYPSTGQTTPYTVGPGGNFNMTPRPNRIDAAFARQLVNSGLPVDYYLEVIPSREEWARLALKSLTAFPKYCFLDTATPIGNLYLYPWPQASIYEIHIICKGVYPVTLTPTTSFANYQPYVIPAMKYNLARRLRQSYGKGLRPDPELNLLAKDALETMRNAQVQIPEMIMPTMLVRPERYNIYSDQTY